MHTTTTTGEGRLLVSGKDGPGIVAAVSAILTGHGANIVSLDQHSTGPSGGRFFQRAVFHLDRLADRRCALEVDLHRELGERFGLHWSLVDTAVPKRVALFASKLDHCLLDLLWRHRRGELPMEITHVVSNHTDLAWVGDRFEVPFTHIPVPKGAKQQAEAAQLDLLKGTVDLVVLARYMQILSGDFLAALGVPVINIHHSFLPAFVGAAPYRKAKERGVKLIGATAHFVTEDLDEGPIIEQDVVRVSHTDSTDDLVRRGADVERLVLARAVKAFCEDRIMRDGNTTVVF
ncbi:formyltetrahydrofolate deformylase [Amycolatopsis thermoflava]|uniref:Formyltetrahydrofolate deformylase n=1 Tax=Amycolatopsis tucumanensis TaxID=401106 RepID=A0ABP7HES9_9PSEU|nr:formyltetrahydrofolate deformylase [Amycolatopsis tucumanensis]MCF6427019.1 formyltetrahydrofolate deformylase [Amycolatopsis tucumanensis]